MLEESFAGWDTSFSVIDPFLLLLGIRKCIHSIVFNQIVFFFNPTHFSPTPAI